MATPEDIRATITTYTNAFGDDREGWLELFADGATVEDPIGTDRHTGKEAIGAFWDFTHSLSETVELRLQSPICVSGQEAAFHMLIVSKVGDMRVAIDAIDAMTFDDDARIVS